MSSLLDTIGGFIGASGLMYGILTMASKSRREKAEADRVEIENIKVLIETWRQEKEASDQLNMSMREELAALRKDIQKLRNTQRKILEKLDQITHQNMEHIIQQIKQDIQNEDN
jgi:chromosome segregation ATPase